MQKLIHPSIARATGFGHAGTCPTAPVGFISDYANNVVYESNNTGAICATLTGFDGPQGISVDRHGNLFVANTGANNVLELGPPYTGAQPTVYNDSGELPVDVAVDNNGDLAVTNIFDSNGNPGNVELYAAGSTNPTGAASNADYTSPRFCAFDKKGNLDLDDIDAYNTGAVNVGVIFSGNFHNSAAVIHPLNGASLTFPGGVQVLNTSGTYGTLTVLDQGSGSGGTIDTYNSLSYPNLGPATITTLTGSGDPVADAFLPAGNGVVVADAELEQADLYKFPAGKLVKDYTVPNDGVPIGAGINPTEQFTLR